MQGSLKQDLSTLNNKTTKLNSSGDITESIFGTYKPQACDLNLCNKDITEAKILFSGTGHGHAGGTDGKAIDLSAYAKVASGQYSGNSSGAARNIAHGLGATPKFIMIDITDGTSLWTGFMLNTRLRKMDDGSSRTVTAMDATNFVVGNASNEFNLNTYSYDFVVVG